MSKLQTRTAMPSATEAFADLETALDPKNTSNSANSKTLELMVASVTGFAERLAAIAICSKCKADLSAPFAEHCTTNYIILDRKTSVIFCDFVQQSRLNWTEKILHIFRVISCTWRKVHWNAKYSIFRISDAVSPLWFSCWDTHAPNQEAERPSTTHLTWESYWCREKSTLRLEGWTQARMMRVPCFKARPWKTLPKSASAASPCTPLSAAFSRGTSASSKAPQNVAPSTSLASTISSAFSKGAATSPNPTQCYHLSSAFLSVKMEAKQYSLTRSIYNHTHTMQQIQQIQIVHGLLICEQFWKPCNFANVQFRGRENSRQYLLLTPCTKHHLLQDQLPPSHAKKPGNSESHPPHKPQPHKPLLSERLFVSPAHLHKHSER